MLPLHFALVRRYAPLLSWRLFLATEFPDDPIIKEVARDYDVTIVTIPLKEAGFLDSRAAACMALPPEIKYVFPIQEDFLLDRTPDYAALAESLKIFEECPDIASIRYMPCPGPASNDPRFVARFSLHWRVLDPENNEYMYCFQATMWRRHEFEAWYGSLRHVRDELVVKRNIRADQQMLFEVRENLAENAIGQGLFRHTMCESWRHLAWERIYKHANGVYFSPWPYRPTAIVKGVLQPWANELSQREGMEFRV
jgi:hypothetical protein